MIRRRTRPGTTLTTAFVLMAATLAGCGADTDGPAVVVFTKDEDGLNGTLIEPPPRVAPVTLRDTSDRPIRLDRLPRGGAAVVFFGFTNCDDVCPTTMADLAATRRALLPKVASRVLLYFVTVDPQRDTPPVLRAWLDQFDSGIVGVRGPIRLVHQAERSLYAAPSSIARHQDEARAGDPDSHDAGGATHARRQYEVNHSGSVYVFGPHGETVVYTGGTTVAQYTADLIEIMRRS